MRCRICSKTIKHAGKITRKRRVCGECMYAIKFIIKMINTTKSLISVCKTKKL